VAGASGNKAERRAPPARADDRDPTHKINAERGAMNGEVKDK
jgi:hypothetical protein